MLNQMWLILRWILLFSILSTISLLGRASDSLGLLQEWKHKKYCYLEFYLSSPPLSGRLDLNNHGLFSIEISGDVKQKIVHDGRYVWIWDKALEQVTRTTIKSFKTANPLAIFSQPLSDLSSSFKIENTEKGVYRFIPRLPSLPYEFIELYFDHALPIALIVKDHLHHDLQIFEITKVVCPTQGWSQGVFSFHAPKGIDTLYLDHTN